MGYYEDLDLSHDLEVMQGLDSATLKVEGLPDVALDDCVLTEPIDTREMEPSDGQVPQMDQLFVWPIYRSPAKPPLGSVLVDADDTYWTIIALRRKQHVETWEAHGRDITVLPSTINTATVLQAHFHKGDANEAKPHWKGLFSGQHPPTDADQITARFQPATEEAVLRFDAEWTKQSVRIILENPLPLDLANGEYRLVTSTGERYRVLRYFDASRIDRKPVLFAVKILEGREYWRSGTPAAPLPQPVFPAP